MPRTPKTKPAPKRVNIQATLASVAYHLNHLRVTAELGNDTWYAARAQVALSLLNKARRAYIANGKQINESLTRIDHKLTGVEHMARFMANARKRGGK